MNKQAYAFKTIYTNILDIKEIDAYKEFFLSQGIPSKSKSGIVCDMCRSTPYINKNYVGFSKDTLKNSYLSALFSPVDYEHYRDEILGTIIKSDLVEDEGESYIVRIAAAVWKDRLSWYGLENLTKWQYSMECLYNDYIFYVAGEFIDKNDAPVEWIEKLYNWDIGEPVYDSQGRRVALILGGINGYVEFNGIGIVSVPADDKTQTLLQVANKGGNKNMKMIPEDEHIQAIASAKAEVENEFKPQIEELERKVNEITASITEKNVKISELEASLASEKERADKAEALIKEKEITERFELRKQAIASKNLTYRAEKEDFIKTAEDEVFNDWLADLEVVASLKLSQATANAKDIQPITISLTKDSQNDINVFI